MEPSKKNLVLRSSNPIRVHVISRGKKWAVVKSGAKKATSLHQFREQAYFEARQISNHVVVHHKNGTVLFQYSENKIWMLLDIIRSVRAIGNHAVYKTIKKQTKTK